MTDEPIKRYAPYLAWRTFFNLILQLDEKGLPTRIDRSFLSQRSGVDQGYLIATLKAFAMIADDGTVLDPLKGLVGNRDGRQALMAQVLRAHYPEVFELPSNATQAELDEVFREVFAQTGTTLRKAQTFLLHGVAFAGVKLSPYFKTPRGVPGAAGPRRTRKRATPRGSGAVATTVTPATVTTDTAAALRPEATADDMRLRYFEVLLKKVDSADETDTDLLDRIERLIGADRPVAQTALGRRPQNEATGEGAAEAPLAEA
jgi:hypothetical protein